MSIVWAVAAFLLASLIATACLFLMYGGNLMAKLSNIEDGVGISIITLITSIVQIGVIVHVVQSYRFPVKGYLGLKLPSRRIIIQALLLLLAVLLVLEGATLLLGQSTVPPFQVNSYRSAKAAGWLAGLFAAVVVFAPLWEEIVFRGFLYRGFVRRAGHEPYAIVVTSLIWTAEHALQFEFLALAQIFIMGILLGALRWWSGSTSLTILLHVLANFLATIETVIYVEWLSK